MSGIIKQAIDTFNTVTPTMQEKAARLLVDFAGDESGIYHLTPEEHAAQDEADEAIARGDFATDEEMQVLFDEYK